MILGIDEVGRGPWAGPLVIGAVILPEEKPEWVNELTDSKKLSKKKREKLSEIIINEAPATALGWVSSEEIDKLGLTESLKLATRRAVKEIQKKNIPFSEIVIDGTINFLAGTPLDKHVSILKKADFLVKEVSGASIIAKVARDQYMKKLAEIYPNYGFEKHVGYGTAFHKKAIEDFGVTPEHRKSFKPIREILGLSEEKLEEERITTKKIGDKAENIVAEYLEKNGHEIIARNFKTPFYEIDIISKKDDYIYFTEVKYRKDDFAGGGLFAVDERKQKQMEFATESFLKFKKEFKNLNPLLAVADVSGKKFELKNWFTLV